MGYDELIKERERYSRESGRELSRRANALQSALFSALLGIIDGLELSEDGTIKRSGANVRRLTRVQRVFRSYRLTSNGLGRWLIERMRGLFGLNTDYFGSFQKVSETREKRAARLVFSSLGYDLDKREVMESSWLDLLLAQDDVKRKVMNRLNTALQSGISMKDFKEQFKRDFTDSKEGLGLVTKNMDFHARNVFQQFDRSTQNVYRQELKLEYCIYSGTIQRPTKNSSGTRDFCWRRAGNLYEVGEAEKWNSKKWQGKIDGVDVFQQAGGYNCRHHFSYISKELAERLIEKGKELNKLNAPKPKR